MLLPVDGTSSTWVASRTGGAAAAPEDAREYAAVVWLVSGVGWSADTPLRLLVLLLDHATTMGGRSLVPGTAVLLVRGMLRLCLTRASLLGSCGATGVVVMMVFCDGDARHRQRRHGGVDGDDDGESAQEVRGGELASGARGGGRAQTCGAAARTRARPPIHGRAGVWVRGLVERARGRVQGRRCCCRSAVRARLGPRPAQEGLRQQPLKPGNTRRWCGWCPVLDGLR